MSNYYLDMVRPTQQRDTDSDRAIAGIESAMMHHAYQYEQWAEYGMDDEREANMTYHRVQLDKLTRALVVMTGNDNAAERRAWATKRAASRVHGE